MLEVEEADEKVALSAFTNGLKSGRFAFSLAKRPPEGMAELMSKAWKHMNAEEVMKTKREAEAPPPKTEKKRQDDYGDDRKSKTSRTSESRGCADDRRERFKGFPDFTPLISKMEEVFYAIKDDPEFKWTKEMRAPPQSQDKSKCCLFHQDHDHDTENCFSLKRLVEELIRKEKYNGFIAEKKGERREDRSSPTPQSPDRRQGPQQPLGEIRVVSRGFAGGGGSSSARKRYVREVQKE